REIYRVYRGLSPGERLLFHPFPTTAVPLAALLVGLVSLRRLTPRFVAWFPRAAAQLVVARRSDDRSFLAIGTLNFARSPRGVGPIARTGLYVVPTARRHGVGWATNDWMLDRARRLGARRAEALVVPRNVASRALYEAMGYRLEPSTIRDKRPPNEVFLLASRELT
ncbi:MAG: GNAT family N-acetyltransferase, partial [Thermoplasmata archaeon]|nr:GNAT family N-acetyltransferase [Thermoplasmata archaeon]